MQLLIVDDDPAVRDSLARAMKLDGHAVELAADGEQGLQACRRRSPDAVILDVAMPVLDGPGMCRQLRADGDRTPVLMLTARDAVADRVAGLDSGADDYLAKPFALEELKARLRALTRRSGGGDEPLAYAGVSLDPATYEVRRGEREVELTRTEFSLLRAFLEHPRQVLTRTLLFERVWGYDFGRSSNSLEVYVGYLRRKLEAGGEPRVIQTIRGVGYVMRES